MLKTEPAGYKLIFGIPEALAICQNNNSLSKNIKKMNPPLLMALFIYILNKVNFNMVVPINT